MSLATRCTACGTVFRVVQDQLKVSEGWVRCGRCGDVFNALEGLFDLARDAPPDALEPMSPAAPAIAGGSADRHASTAAATAPSLIDKIDAQLKKGSRAGDHHGVAPAISARDRLEFPDAQFDPDMVDGESMMEAPPAPGAPLDAPEFGSGSSSDTDVEPAAAGAAPEFLQQAQRRARWQSPRMRALQGFAVAALIALLGLQMAHHDRDGVAARWPAALPVLTAWCAMLSCAIDAPRRIEDVAVESTALTRASADAFRLSVSLRNRGATAVAQPSVDLSLTDANGQLIARRMLSARDFRVASTTIPAGSEAALSLTLTAGTARVSGYTVELFYP